MFFSFILFFSRDYCVLELCDNIFKVSFLSFSLMINELLMFSSLVQVRLIIVFFHFILTDRAWFKIPSFFGLIFLIYNFWNCKQIKIWEILSSQRLQMFNYKKSYFFLEFFEKVLIQQLIRININSKLIKIFTKIKNVNAIM